MTTVKVCIYLLCLIWAMPAASQEQPCTDKHIDNAVLKEPIPFEPGSAVNALSKFFNCRITISDARPAYAADGSLIGQIVGFYDAEKPLTGSDLQSKQFWIVEDKDGGGKIAIGSDSVSVEFKDFEWVGIALASKNPVIAKYNPKSPPSTGFFLVGPDNGRLQAQLSDYVAVAFANSGLGLKPSDIYGVTFVSNPTGASIWIGPTLYANTVAGLIINGSDIHQVRMSLGGYEDCGQSQYKVEDSGYGSKTISCEMVQVKENKP
ncbi:hypothetical protein [Aminobacter sp. LjRoot7]|uniref:hypothetical protein n=1 Tax=Aminobacter sp. LjRoot7 TaxID=3342335 RepID=UPI003ED14D33